MLKIFTNLLKKDESTLPDLLRPGIYRAQTHREHLYPKSQLHDLSVEGSYLPTTETLGQMLWPSSPVPAPSRRSA
jgi:hypothetical protein